MKIAGIMSTSPFRKCSEGGATRWIRTLEFWLRAVGREMTARYGDEAKAPGKDSSIPISSRTILHTRASGDLNGSLENKGFHSFP
jgi:hypothetical protein